MLKYLSFNTVSPLLPKTHIPLWDHHISNDLVRALDTIIEKEENHILEITEKSPDVVPGDKWMTGRLWYYNFLTFDYPEVRQLQDVIRKNFFKYMEAVNLPTEETNYIQCWVNIIRQNRTITKHNHSTAHADLPPIYSYLSGNIAIRTNVCQSTTYYEHPLLDGVSIGVKNIDGSMILFPSYINHWVSDNQSEVPRLSIAFDIVPESYYKMCQKMSNYVKL